MCDGGKRTSVTAGRDLLRATFDGAATLYDEVRPGYPDALFDDAVSLSAIPDEGRILEIGCGTGQATIPFARRGYRILCVELGENLAAVARSNLASYPGVDARVGDFEAFPIRENYFDLFVSATAFHWLDPTLAYPKAARSLRAGGAVALFWNEHVHTDASEGFFEAAQEIYERETPEIVKPGDRERPPHPDEVPDRKAEISVSGHFGDVVRRDYVWDESYDAEGYIQLLSTYSGHINLSGASRKRLFDSISALIEDRHGGRIVKGYLTTLYVARKQ